jgi:branched-chain amino acid transport system substrate-binding protein
MIGRRTFFRMARGLVGLLAALAVACGPQPGAPAQPEAPKPPIRVGASVSLTGRYQVEGRMTQQGYELAVEMLNAKGGVNGHRFELVIYDNQSDAATTTSLYRKLIFEDKVDFLLGPYGTPLTRPVVPLVEQAQMPMVTTEAAGTEIWRGQNLRWSTQLMTPVERYNVGLIELAKRLAVKAVAYVYANTPSTVQGAETDRGLLAQAGVNLVLFERYEPDQVDFNVLASKAKATNAELFVMNGYFQDAVNLTKAMSAVGYRPRYKYLGFTVVTEDYLKSVGDLAHCVMGSANWLPTLKSKGFIATNEEFVSRFRAKYGTEPDYRAATAFGGVELLAEAIKASLDRTGKIDKAFVRDYIFRTKTATVFGPYEVVAEGLDAGMQVGAGSYTIQWQKDPRTGSMKLEVLWPDQYATVKEPCTA